MTPSPIPALDGFSLWIVPFGWSTSSVPLASGSYRRITQRLKLEMAVDDGPWVNVPGTFSVRKPDYVAEPGSLIDAVLVDHVHTSTLDAVSVYNSMQSYFGFAYSSWRQGVDPDVAAGEAAAHTAVMMSIMAVKSTVGKVMCRYSGQNAVGTELEYLIPALRISEQEDFVYQRQAAQAAVDLAGMIGQPDVRIKRLTEVLNVLNFGI